MFAPDTRVSAIGQQRFLALGVVALVVALLGSRSTAAPRRPPLTLSSALPVTTRVIVHVPDRRRLTDAWQETTLSQEVAKGAFESLFQPFRSALGGARKLQSWVLLDLTVDDFEQLSARSIAWAAVEQAGQLKRVLAIETASTERQAMTRWLRDFADRQRQAGGQGGKQSLQGVTVYTWRNSDPERQRCLVVHRGWLWISEDPDCLAPIVSATADSTRLGSDPGWQYIAQRNQQLDSDQTSQLRWWVDIRGLAHLPTTDREDQEWLTHYRELGWDAIRCAGGSLRFAGDDWQSLAHSFIYHDRPLTQAARMLSFVNRPINTRTAMGNMSLDAISQLNVDWSAAISGYASRFDHRHGEGEHGVFDLVLDEIRDDADAPQVDVRRDLFAQLEQPLTMLRGTGAGDLQSNAPARLFFVPVIQPQVVQQAVDRLMAGDPDANRRQLAGQTIWQFQELAAEADQPILGPDVSGWAIGVVANHLVVTNQLELLRQFAVGQAATNTELLDSVRDEAERLNMHPLCGWQTYRIRPLLTTWYQRLRDGQRDQHSFLFRRFFKALAPHGQSLDWSAVDVEAVVTDELGWGFQLGRTIEDGWQVTTFTVAP